MDPHYQSTHGQSRWCRRIGVERRAFEANETSARPKYYCVSMLPYPSSKLHMGTCASTINDALYHFMRMKGFCLMPMGLGCVRAAGGKPAMANGVPPGKWTWDNIAYMKQCQAMGWAIDWTREIATLLADYYRWNQWCFLRMWRTA